MRAKILKFYWCLPNGYDRTGLCSKVALRSNVKSRARDHRNKVKPISVVK